MGSKMEKDEFLCTKLEQLLETGIVCAEKSRTKGTDDPAGDPLYYSEELRKLLIAGADSQERPFIYRDELQVFFACIRCKNRHYMIGPMCTVVLGRMEIHQFYRTYGIAESGEKRLKFFTISKVLGVVELMAKELLDIEYSDEELLYVNHIVEESRANTSKEQVFFEFRGGEMKMFHHTYQEERKLLECVRNGDVEEAVRYSKNLDNNVGKLSAKALTHWKNVSVVAITLATRAAMEGGLPPFVAYKLSDFYIQKSDRCKDVAQVLDNRNRAVEEITALVHRKKEEGIGSRCTELCKEYIERHYREKIYLKDIADKIGVSAGYLSKTFHKEEGISVQEYVIGVRVEHAANLLMYSDESIARIGDYVNFPSQSYFGKMFKRYKNVSPGKFREQNKPIEF